MLRTSLFVSVLAALALPVAALSQNAVSPPTVLNGNRETLHHACTDGEALNLTGSSNRVTLTASCDSIEVHGSNNTVDIESFHALRVSGDGNHFNWPKAAAQSEPHIQLTGTNNIIPNN